jgi:hypothetical protein
VHIVDFVEINSVDLLKILYCKLYKNSST